MNITIPFFELAHAQNVIRDEEDRLLIARTIELLSEEIASESLKPHTKRYSSNGRHLIELEIDLSGSRFFPGHIRIIRDRDYREIMMSTLKETYGNNGPATIHIFGHELTETEEETPREILKITLGRYNLG